MLTSLPPAARREAHRLLARLLELPPERRPAALAAECDDADLRDAVLRLLREVERPDGPFDPGSARSRSLWTRVARDSAERERAIAQGARLGPYRIVEEIERGGMAVVYRAEQADGEIEREVAVKILKLGLDTEEVVRRFHQERQILADLDHPDIARLYAAGRTEDGRPYFVMELVEGLPIDRYCVEHRLSVEERLKLFCVVAEAVDYAHKNLIVHRDLKPANILVSHRVAHGGAELPAGRGRSPEQSIRAVPSAGSGPPRPTPQVKLLDFGIARLLDVEADGGSAAPPTRSPLRLMTPEYASPEQVRGERVTTASDVYQLGLLLYELLTGRRPYTSRNGSAAELERVICEQPPPRPSTVVDRTRLRRRLRGDLDDIVLQALRKEPLRRYSSAERLAQDIHRHLGGLPVTARADTWAYRGRKFFRRHAVGAAATAAVLVAAIGLAGFHSVRIRAERDRAEAERDRARAAAVKAEQVSGFLTNLFRSVDPREARGTELTARELLDRGVAQVGFELAGQPRVRAEMLQVLARTYLELGVYDAAEELLTQALSLRRRQVGTEHPDVAGIVGTLGLLRYRQGRYETARDRLAEAIHILEVSRGRRAPELAGVLATLGDVHRDLGEHEKSRVAIDRALSIQKEATGSGSEPVAAILHGKASLLAEMGALDRAEDFLRRSLAIRERQLGRDHPVVGRTLLNLASVRAMQGKHQGVEAMYRRSLTIQRQAYGPVHAEVVQVLSNLGAFLIDAERHEEAVTLLERALEIQTTTMGPDHPTVAYTLSSLGGAHLASGRLDDALHYYRRSVTVRERVLGARPFDPVLVHDLTQLSAIEDELGHAATAGRLLNRASKMWHEAPEATDPRLGPTLLRLSRWLAGQGRCEEATPLLRRALDLEIDRNDRRPEHAELNRLLARCSEAPSNITVADVTG